MPADYTSSINLRDGRQVVVSGFCRNGERRISLRIRNEVVFMDEMEAITLIREITMALSRTCREYKGREAQQKQPQKQQHQGQAQQKQAQVKQQSQEKRADAGLEVGKLTKI